MSFKTPWKRFFGPTRVQSGPTEQILTAKAEEPWVNTAGVHRGSPEETPLTSTGTGTGRDTHLQFPSTN